MTIKITSDCMACGQCVELCEHGAIEVESGGKRYGQATINTERCKKCGMCLVFDCPGEAIVCVNDTAGE